MIESPAALELFISQIHHPAYEPAYEEYKGHFAALSGIIARTGEALEGNLFTDHLVRAMPEYPADFFRTKRSNFAVFCSSGSSLLEIGFNAGHSCLLAMCINPELSYTGVDIGWHKYTRPCFDYLHSVFGDRVRLHIGDSREVMPRLIAEPARHDLYHLDGGHGFDVAHADLVNILRMAEGGRALLLVDDTDNAHIDAMCDLYLLRGRIDRMRLNRVWHDTRNHELFRINGA
ncbi:MAG: class I SAM-dependent methyltransferase [Pseudomonadota bacterium]